MPRTFMAVTPTLPFGFPRRSIMSSPELTSLLVNLFVGLDKLTTLAIILNPKLETLPVGLFKDNTAVTLLNLHGNGLTGFSLGFFDGLTNVETL